MSKFANCFATANELRNYDLVIDNETVGTAHTLTVQDRAEIERKSITKVTSAEGMSIDINSNMHMLYTVLRALDSWILDVPINVDNLSKHPMLGDLFTAIMAHEENVAKTLRDNEKN